MKKSHEATDERAGNGTMRDLAVRWGQDIKGGAPSKYPSERLSLSYEEIKFVYTPQNP